MEADEAVTRLAHALTARRATVATAESCTGGLLSARLTALSGASAYFVGGVVAYADAVKSGALGVDPNLLRQHGAVSEEVAAALARGAREVFGSALAASITGIAGPGGGSPEKPVGLVFMAVARAGGVQVRKETYPGDRDAVRSAAVRDALELLLEATSDLEPVEP